jgi:hypothetical protein
MANYIPAVQKIDWGSFFHSYEDDAETTQNEAKSEEDEEIAADRKKEEQDAINSLIMEDSVSTMMFELYVQLCANMVPNYNFEKDTVISEEGFQFKRPENFTYVKGQPLKREPLPTVKSMMYPGADAPACNDAINSINARDAPPYTLGSVSVKSKLFRSKPSQMPEAKWLADFKPSEETNSNAVLRVLADRRKIDFNTYPQGVGLSMTELNLYERLTLPGDIRALTVRIKIPLTKQNKHKPGCTFFGLTLKKDRTDTLYRPTEEYRNRIMPKMYQDANKLRMSADEVDKALGLVSDGLDNGNTPFVTGGHSIEQLVVQAEEFAPVPFDLDNRRHVSQMMLLWNNGKSDATKYLESMVQKQTVLTITDESSSEPKMAIASDQFGSGAAATSYADHL